MGMRVAKARQQHAAAAVDLPVKGRILRRRIRSAFRPARDKSAVNSRKTASATTKITIRIRVRPLSYSLIRTILRTIKNPITSMTTLTANMIFPAVVVKNTSAYPGFISMRIKSRKIGSAPMI